MCGKGGDTSPERQRREGNNRPGAGAPGLCLPIVRYFRGEPIQNNRTNRSRLPSLLRSHRQAGFTF